MNLPLDIDLGQRGGDRGFDHSRLTPLAHVRNALQAELRQLGIPEIEGGYAVCKPYVGEHFSTYQEANLGSTRMHILVVTPPSNLLPNPNVSVFQEEHQPAEKDGQRTEMTALCITVMNVLNATPSNSSAFKLPFPVPQSDGSYRSEGQQQFYKRPSVSWTNESMFDTSSAWDYNPLPVHVPHDIIIGDEKTVDDQVIEHTIIIIAQPTGRHSDPYEYTITSVPTPAGWYESVAICETVLTALNPNSQTAQQPEVKAQPAPEVALFTPLQQLQQTVERRLITVEAPEIEEGYAVLYPHIALNKRGTNSDRIFDHLKLREIYPQVVMVAPPSILRPDQSIICTANTLGGLQLSLDVINDRRVPTIFFDTLTGDSSGKSRDWFTHASVLSYSLGELSLGDDPFVPNNLVANHQRREHVIIVTVFPDPTGRLMYDAQSVMVPHTWSAGLQRREIIVDGLYQKPAEPTSEPVQVTEPVVVFNADPKSLQRPPKEPPALLTPEQKLAELITRGRDPEAVFNTITNLLGIRTEQPFQRFFSRSTRPDGQEQTPVVVSRTRRNGSLRMEFQFQGVNPSALSQWLVSDRQTFDLFDQSFSERAAHIDESTILTITVDFTRRGNPINASIYNPHDLNPQDVQNAFRTPQVLAHLISRITAPMEEHRGPYFDAASKSASSSQPPDVFSGLPAQTSRQNTGPQSSAQRHQLRNKKERKRKK